MNRSCQCYNVTFSIIQYLQYNNSMHFGQYFNVVLIIQVFENRVKLHFSIMLSFLLNRIFTNLLFTQNRAIDLSCTIKGHLIEHKNMCFVSCSVELQIHLPYFRCLIFNIQKIAHMKITIFVNFIGIAFAIMAIFYIS